MSSLKRSRPTALLERRVRPRKEEDSEVEEDFQDLSQDGESEALSEDGQSGESGASEDEEGSDGDENVRYTAYMYHKFVLIFSRDLGRNRKKRQTQKST